VERRTPVHRRRATTCDRPTLPTPPGGARGDIGVLHPIRGREPRAWLLATHERALRLTRSVASEPRDHRRIAGGIPLGVAIRVSVASASTSIYGRTRALRPAVSHGCVRVAAPMAHLREAGLRHSCQATMSVGACGDFTAPLRATSVAMVATPMKDRAIKRRALPRPRHAEERLPRESCGLKSATSARSATVIASVPALFVLVCRRSDLDEATSASLRATGVSGDKPALRCHVHSSRVACARHREWRAPRPLWPYLSLVGRAAVTRTAGCPDDFAPTDDAGGSEVPEAIAYVLPRCCRAPARISLNSPPGLAGALGSAPRQKDADTSTCPASGTALLIGMKNCDQTRPRDLSVAFPHARRSR